MLHLVYYFADKSYGGVPHMAGLPPLPLRSNISRAWMELFSCQLMVVFGKPGNKCQKVFESDSFASLRWKMFVVKPMVIIYTKFKYYMLYTQ